MEQMLIADFSAQLKEIAKDLSFLGHPRYPLRELYQLFPQHKSFIGELEDVSVPFNVKVDEKRKAIEIFLYQLSRSDISPTMKKIFTQRVEDYNHLLAMLENFDNVFFYEHCTKLYGTSHQLARITPFSISWKRFLNTVCQTKV